MEMTVNHEIWDQWEQQALTAGVPTELAALGRSVIRDTGARSSDRFGGSIREDGKPLRRSRLSSWLQLSRGPSKSIDFDDSTLFL
jgi:hypothetical protein